MRPPWKLERMPPRGLPQDKRAGFRRGRASDNHPDPSTRKPLAILQPVSVGAQRLAPKGTHGRQDMNGRQPEGISARFFIELSPTTQQLYAHELVRLLDFLKQALLCFCAPARRHVDADRRELRAQASALSLARRSRGSRWSRGESADGTDRSRTAEVRIACMGERASICEKYPQTAPPHPREKWWSASYIVQGCRQSGKGSADSASLSVPCLPRLNGLEGGS